MSEEEQVSAEEVNKFLSSEGNIDPEIVKAASEEFAAQQQKEAEPQSVPRDMKFDEDINRSMSFFRLGSVDVEIEPNEMEKGLFVKAALTDTPFILDVELPLGADTITVTCQSMSEFEYSVVFTALDKMIREAMITTDGMYASVMQDLCSYIQLKKVGDAIYKYAFNVNMEAEAGTEADRLIETHHKYSKTLGGPMRVVVISALKKFTAIEKVCTDNLLNEDFWSPADAG